MKLRIALVALIILLQGCTIASEVYLADGTKGYNIDCGGAIQNFGACLERAGDLCAERGYTVINQAGEAVPFSTAGGGFSANPQFASGGFSGQSGAIVTRNLFIKCKDGK